MASEPNMRISELRFEFGRNWGNYIRHLDDERISEAERSLKNMLGVETLAGKDFLDVGSGSGLFSLAARRLGARVHSFDFDESSVETTNELKRRFFSEDSEWIVERGSILDKSYLSQLGQFDVVYAWGVLHHTGDMWAALSNISSLVAQNGRLFLAIYNDQGGWSKRWLVLKRTYNRLPRMMRLPYAVAVMGPREAKSFLYSILTFQPGRYIRNWTHYKTSRGMSRWHDLLDWVGGYPFEVAKPEEIFEYYRGQGFELDKLKTCAGGLGCNEYIFTKG